MCDTRVLNSSLSSTGTSPGPITALCKAASRVSRQTLMAVTRLGVCSPVQSAMTLATVSALNGLSPSFFGFVLSFLVIGRFWSGHSAALSDMVKYDPRLSRPNLLFLMAIALMPFATAFMTHNIGQLVPTLFYNATLLVTALLSFWVIRIATDRSSNCSMHDPDEASGLRFRAVLAIGGCLLAVSLAFVAPSYSQVPLIPLLVWERFQWVWKRKSS